MTFNNNKIKSKYAQQKAIFSFASKSKEFRIYIKSMNAGKSLLHCTFQSKRINFSKKFAISENLFSIFYLKLAECSQKPNCDMLKE
jgi:hypothetical protein